MPRKQIILERSELSESKNHGAPGGGNDGLMESVEDRTIRLSGLPLLLQPLEIVSVDDFTHFHRTTTTPIMMTFQLCIADDTHALQQHASHVKLARSSRERTLFEMLMKIQRRVEQRILALYAGWSISGKMVRPICVVLLSLLLEGCTKPAVHEPVTLTLLEEWTNKAFSEARQQELQQFTRETGIRVSLLPSPETAQQKLALWKELLGTGASGPDVYGIDVIWPRILNEYFIDLKPYFGNEISLQFPEIAASYTVDGKLVAMAYRADVGLLFYRRDLLRKYGYREPPENMG